MTPDTTQPRDTIGRFSEKNLSTPEVDLDMLPARYRMPAEVRAQLDAALAELGMGDAVTMMPEDGFVDGYYDIVAYDGADGRMVKVTIGPDGHLDHTA